MRTFERIGDLRAHISTMVLCCGAKFPEVGPYGKDQSANIQIAFDELRSGLPLLRKKLQDDAKLQEVERLIGASLHAYQSGECKQGAHLLQGILNIAFPGRFAAYARKKEQPL